MFLRWVNSLGLLPTEDDTNILLNFSYPVKRVVVSEIVNHLLDPETSPKILTTPTHVKWVLEVIGQGFSLPIEDVPIMEKCVALYSQWLLSPPELRPPGFKEQDQYFFQRMFFHLSNLFEPRARDDGPASVSGPQNQVKLCKDVLETIFLAGAQKLSTSVTTETWESWLKLMMGIVDSIFRNRGSSGAVAHSFLIKSLGPPAFRVLLEMWLLSKTENVDLWNCLLALVPSWLIVPTIWHWNSLCLALSMRTLNLMYGKDHGSETIAVDWMVDEKTVVKSFISLPGEYVFFAWQKFLHLLPNPNTHTEPELYRHSFMGISKMVEAYLHVAEQVRKENLTKKKTKQPPSGNTLLAIFGRWLFEAVLTDRQGFEDGTSVALATLCRIFTRERGTFLSVHLSSFYSCLEKVLMKDINDKVLSTALLNSRSLFVRELQGSFMLLPCYFYAFSRVWRENGPEPNIRSACIDILATLISLSDHYGDVPVLSRMVAPILYSESAGLTPSEPFSRLDNIRSLKPHLQFLMSRAIVKEESARNIQRLLWCIVALVLQIESRGSMPAAPETDLQFAEFIIAEILRRARRSWAADVIMVAFSALSSLTAIYKFFGPNKFETARGIVSALSESALNAMNANVNDWEREDHDRMLHRTLITMTDWLMVDPEFTALCDQNTYSNLLRSIATVLGAIAPVNAPPPGTKPYIPSPSTRSAALFALNNLLYRSGEFPLTVGPHRVSSEVSEEDILAMIVRDSGGQVDMEGAKQYMRYFLLDNSIVLNLIDLPYQEAPTIVLITRDGMGKHVWSTRLRMYEDTDRINPAPQDPAHNSAPVVPVPVNLDKYDSNVVEQLYTELLNYLPAVWAGRYYESAIAAVTEHYIPQEQEFLRQKSWGLNKDIHINIPSPREPYAGDCKFVFSRIFLSHLGLLLPENFGRLQVLEHSWNGFDKQLASLDAMNEREAFSVGVVLMEKAPTKKFEYLVAEGGPVDYQEFLSAVGWAVNLWEHTGFRGNLIDQKCGDYAPYFASYSTEIIFAVCTWMPNTIYDTADKVIAFKRRLLAQNNVTVVWNLLDDYDPSAVTALQKDMVQIVITPLPSGLYHCRVYRDNKPFVMGPLLDSMILSKRLLGEMVRRTAVLANHMLMMEKAPVAPFQQRKQAIDSLAQNYSRPIPYDEFLMYLFSKKVPEPQPPVGQQQQPTQQQQQQAQQPQPQQVAAAPSTPASVLSGAASFGQAMQHAVSHAPTPQPAVTQPMQTQPLAQPQPQPQQPPPQAQPMMQQQQYAQQPSVLNVSQVSQPGTAPSSNAPLSARAMSVAQPNVSQQYPNQGTSQQASQPMLNQSGSFSLPNLAQASDSAAEQQVPGISVSRASPRAGMQQSSSSTFLPRAATPTGSEYEQNRMSMYDLGSASAPAPAPQMYQQYNTQDNQAQQVVTRAAAPSMSAGIFAQTAPAVSPRPQQPVTGGAPKVFLPPVIGVAKTPAAAPGPAPQPYQQPQQPGPEKKQGGFARFFGAKKDDKDKDPKKK